MYMTPHGRQQVHMKECWKTTDVRDAATLEPRTRVVCVCVLCFLHFGVSVCENLLSEKRENDPLPYRAEYFLLDQD